MLFLFIALGMVGCSDDEGTGNGSVTLEQGVSSVQTIYADETSLGKGEGITFTTSGPWYAQVEEVLADDVHSSVRASGVSARAVDWITLSQDRGDAAGEYTLYITLTVNDTGEARKAIIRIICGDAVVTITIEQGARTEAGELSIGWIT